MSSPLPSLVSSGVLFWAILLISESVACFQPRHTASSPPSAPTVLDIGSQITIRYSAPWAESGYQYGNAKELVRRPGPSDSNGARMLITTEQRLSLADAQRRLLDVSRLRSGQPSFYSIGGWPAVELRFQEPLPIQTVADNIVAGLARSLIAP